jgi:predicted 2-oxoglutarate/Fe(II)-dependent dioxygenase YbiX
MGEQEELRMHHDVAQVSASIKLNDDYDGALLEFPRQNFTNADVAVGDALVWPSLVTHPHASTQLTRGEKYSLTIWCELPMPMDGVRSY